MLEDKDNRESNRDAMKASMNPQVIWDIGEATRNTWENPKELLDTKAILDTGEVTRGTVVTSEDRQEGTSATNKGNTEDEVTAGEGQAEATIHK